MSEAAILSLAGFSIVVIVSASTVAILVVRSRRRPKSNV